MNLLGPVTYQFIHISTEHLKGNMVFLFFFGSFVELTLGKRNFLFYHLLGGIFGALLILLISILMGADMRHISYFGASGSIASLMAASMIILCFSRVKTSVNVLFPIFYLPIKLKYLPAAYIAYRLLNDMEYISRTFNKYDVPLGVWSHIGGFIFGAAICFVFHAKSEEEIERKEIAVKCNKFFRRIVMPSLRLTPATNDPAKMVKLARKSQKKNNMAESESYYRKAIISLCLRGNKELAALILAEYYKKLNRIFTGSIQVELCRVLIELGEYESAEKMLNTWVLKSKRNPEKIGYPIIEKAYLLLSNILMDKLNRASSARWVLSDFIKRFPNTLIRVEIENEINCLKNNGNRKANPERELFHHLSDFKTIILPNLVPSYYILSESKPPRLRAVSNTDINEAKAA